jgi:hypothetical protein
MNDSHQSEERDKENSTYYIICIIDIYECPQYPFVRVCCVSVDVPARSKQNNFSRSFNNSSDLHQIIRQGIGNT